MDKKKGIEIIGMSSGIAAELALLHSVNKNDMPIVQAEEEKQRGIVIIEEKPNVIKPVEPTPDLIAYDFKEPKNYINGKKLPFKKRKK